MNRFQWLRKVLVVLFAAQVLMHPFPEVWGAIQTPPASMKVADGFEVSIAAAPPLVGYPMMACLDDLGRLYVAESDGRNLTTRAEIEQELPRFVRRLVDVDGDGVYDESTIFADRMTMPEGGLWHQGALYIISAPYLWRLEDIDDDGVADKREKILGTMQFDGRANQHGPYLGPNGKLYFSGGHFGYDLVGSDGSRSGVSRAAGVFSCWPDGSGVRVEGQGGINPVDIVFTENGEMLSTCAIFDSFGGRHDALIHWIRGGLTQRVYGVPLVPETGYRLPATRHWGQVAPAGLVRYRGRHFGEDYQDTLFACHFNTHKVVQLGLESSGATFTTTEQDFLVSSSGGFHPADIVEDADGSLILLDTGGWLSWGCPYSKGAKPDIKGAIYRIRRPGGDITRDPRGLQIDWAASPHSLLAGLLEDSRPAVRDRARETLVARGNVTVNAVIEAFEAAPEPDVRKRCLWILSRLHSESGRGALRNALTDSDAGVRQAAARSLGTLKDEEAVLPLARLLNDSSAPVRRTVATALGKIGDGSAVPWLFNALPLDGELYLQHAITYALIEIDDPVAAASYLSDSSRPDWQRTALRVMDQLARGLEPPMVVPLLTSPNASVRGEARRVIALRPQWRQEVLQVFSGFLSEPTITQETAQLIEGIVLAFAGEETFHDLLGEALRAESTSSEAKRRLLATLNFLDTLPVLLHEAVHQLLRVPDQSVKGEALSLALRFDAGKAVMETVGRIASESGESHEVRVVASEVIAKHRAQIEGKIFTFLVKLVADAATPNQLSRQAARALGHLDLIHLTEDQSSEICELVAEATSLRVALLLLPFSNQDPARQESTLQWPADRLDRMGVQLAEALGRSPGRSSLEQAQLKAVLNAFPPSLPAAHAALSKLMQSHLQMAGDRDANEALLLERLQLDHGEASRGRVLFQTSRAACSMCHRVGGEGGTLGPDLSKIGRVRARRDLLEAVVLPDATLVNGYENYMIETRDGEMHTGLIHRETPEAVYLRNADQREERVARGVIASMKRSQVSVMPSGLDQVLSKQELADIIAFLESCR